MTRIAALLAALALLAVSGGSAAADGPPPAREGAAYAAPLYGTLVRLFDAPEDDPYAPGHRGLDVAAPRGSSVHAAADGVVAFAGSVAGNLSVSVDHPDGVRTTVSYLESVAVHAGQAVSTGQVVGTVGEGHPGVHISARRDSLYFDPLRLLVGSSYADLLSLTR